MRDNRGCIDLLASKIMFRVIIFCFLCVIEVNSTGLLLLYRPRDISSDCAFSEQLRYDISYGMGMSDTITLVFRAMAEIDYQCRVDIVSESPAAFIIVVIKYPNNINVNCAANRDAFKVIRKDEIFRLCDEFDTEDIQTTYFVASVKGRIRFQFLSNSSINSDIKANLYQVTATSARMMPKRGCVRRNETSCMIGDEQYCFTTGVVCDGINNCGFSDWFDERKSSCSLPIEKLGYAPVIAVLAAVLCALLAAGHVLSRCLPPLAHSFFIFNANEDNRLCIDPQFKAPEIKYSSMEKAKRVSLIPISSSSSSNSGAPNGEHVPGKSHQMTILEETPQSLEEQSDGQQYLSIRRKTTIRAMAEKLQNKFCSLKAQKSLIEL